MSASAFTGKTAPGCPTLVVISQVYAPDPAAVGQHITDVSEAMAARGWRVIVYTARRGYDDPSRTYPGRELRNGVDVRRLPLSSLGKSSIAIRLVGGALFLLQATAAALLVRGVTAVLVSTSPPFAHVAALTLRALRSLPFVWWVMDVNPDQLIASGRLTTTSALSRLLEAANRAALRTAFAVIVLDRFMRRRMLAKGASDATLHTIRPWSHNLAAASVDAESNPFRIRHAPDDAFVVMYSGNHAMQHPLETLLAAAERLENDESIRFVFVGGGAGKMAVEERIRAGARNILSLPFQPRESLATSLAAADVHVVSMADNVVGIVHPCKIYGALAAGRPILFFGPSQSHVGDLLHGAAYGVVIQHGDVDGTIRAIRGFQSLTAAARSAIGQAARDDLATMDARERPLEAVCDLICRTDTVRHAREAPPSPEQFFQGTAE